MFYCCSLTIRIISPAQRLQAMPMTPTTVTGPLVPLVARALPLRFDPFCFFKVCCSGSPDAAVWCKGYERFKGRNDVPNVHQSLVPHGTLRSLCFRQNLAFTNGFHNAPERMAPAMAPRASRHTPRYGEEEANIWGAEPMGTNSLFMPRLVSSTRNPRHTSRIHYLKAHLQLYRRAQFFFGGLD